MSLKGLKKELKELVVRECEKDIDPKSIEDDEVLFGSDTRVGLDSLDALQVSMALHENYGVKLTDGKKLRKIMKNIDSLAKYIDAK